MNYRDQRNYENLTKRIYQGVGAYDIPQLEPVQFDREACEFIPFSAAARCKDRAGKGVHFFIDDYRFTRLWSAPDNYLPMLQEFKYVMTPDFSRVQRGHAVKPEIERAFRERVQCDGGAITPGDDYLLRERPCGVHG